MLSIQEGAIQIFSENPGKLYFLTGPEYGVKVQYIEHLKNHYGELEEYSSVDDIISMFRQKSLLPRIPKVYVVRYDKSFISKLSLEVSKQVLKSSITGTIIVLYEDEKDEEKLDKFFPENVIRVNYLTDSIAFKHLKTKFENIPEMFIQEAIRLGKDYFQAFTICVNMSYLSIDELSSMSKSDIEYLFGYSDFSSSENFKLAIASKNYASAISEIELYSGDLSLLIYDVLVTYLEILKVLEKPFGDSYVKPFVNKWTKESVKFMFNITYEQLEKLRSIPSYSPYISLLYICGLLQYKLV